MGLRSNFAKWFSSIQLHKLLVLINPLYGLWHKSMLLVLKYGFNLIGVMTHSVHISRQASHAALSKVALAEATHWEISSMFRWGKRCEIHGKSFRKSIGNLCEMGNLWKTDEIRWRFLIYDDPYGYEPILPCYLWICPKMVHYIISMIRECHIGKPSYGDFISQEAQFQWTLRGYSYFP